MSTDSNAKIFSVIGGCRRTGRWIVPQKTAMLTLFGRAVIDLRQARANSEELEFTCTSAFANITFLVPEGAEVRPSGMAVLGSSRSTVPPSSEPCHLPPISIDAITIIGRLRVRTTDVDPDDEGRRRFRWRRRNAATERAVAETPLGPSATSRGSVTILDTSPGPDISAPAPQAPPVTSAPAPTPASPAAGARRAAETEVTGPADLSAPIAAFKPDAERSPIHDVDIPASIEATALDPAVPAHAALIEGEVEAADEAASDAPLDEPVAELADGTGIGQVPEVAEAASDA